LDLKIDEIQNALGIVKRGKADIATSTIREFMARIRRKENIKSSSNLSDLTSSLTGG